MELVGAQKYRTTDEEEQVGEGNRGGATYVAGTVTAPVMAQATVEATIEVELSIHTTNDQHRSALGRLTNGGGGVGSTNQDRAHQD